MKRRLKAFFRTIWLSLTDTGHYRNALTLRTGVGIKYLYGLLVLLSLAGGIAAAVAIVAFMPQMQRGIYEFKAELPNLYPQELVVTISGAQLSTNQQEPYAIPIPARWKTFLVETDASPGEDDRMPANLAVFDTSANVEDYLDADAFVLFTKRAVVYPREMRRDKDFTTGETEYQKEITFQTYEGTGDQEITRKTYDDFMAGILPFADVVVPVLYVVAVLLIVLFPLLGAAFWMLWMLFYLLFATLLLWVLSRLFGRKLRYGELYRLALYGVTVPLLYQFVAGFVGFNIPGIPDFTVVLLIWMGFVFSRLPKVSTMAFRG